jgi:predicted DCC family thiol-disulfide oxidoreductase YuxK
MPNKQCFEVFFDGACPICSREMALVRGMDRSAAVRFTDIAARDFNPQARGLDAKSLDQKIHGRLPDGSIVTGVEVFRRLYSILGYERLVAWSRWPWLSQLLDFCYAAFAKHRRCLTRPFRA